MLFCFGGEKGIRTLVGGLLQTRFPVVRLRPAQPSLRAGRYSPSRGTHTRDLCILPHIAGFVKRFSEKCGEEVERSRKETHSGVGSAVLPLRVRTRVRFFCAGAR